MHCCTEIKQAHKALNCIKLAFLRISKFVQKLQSISKDVEAFKRKELMSPEEMKHNVEKLSEVAAFLDAAVAELEVKSDTILLTPEVCATLIKIKLKMFFMCFFRT